MKKLVLFLVLVSVSSITVFTLGRAGSVLPGDPVRNISGCDGPKREETSNGVQVKLEICGSDQDGYDIDAANPSTGEKWDCNCRFTLSGVNKDNGESAEVSKEKTITVSSTATGWFNAWGESGLKVKNLKISSFSVSCSKS